MDIPTIKKQDKGSSGFVKEVTLSNFKAEVLETSLKHPVIVDFWAPWCGPCKQLVPLLEKLVNALNGTVTLAKINIDRDPEIAQQMRVQSIPAVFAFFQAQPIDGFMGALPEPQLKAWLEKIVKATCDTSGDEGVALALEQAAEFLKEGKTVEAISIYEEILDALPENRPAAAGKLRCLVVLKEIAKAKNFLESLPSDAAKDKIFDSVRAEIELAEQAGKSLGDATGLESRLASDSNDHQARFDLALFQYASGDREGAVENLLEIVRRNRAWNDDLARKQLLKFFEALGTTDPLTVSGRKRLSSILFS